MLPLASSRWLCARTNWRTQRIHIEINGNVAPSWPLSLFNVVLLNGDTFRSADGPEEPLAHAIWLFAQQIGVDEQNIWDSLDPQLFVSSTFDFRVKRLSKRAAEFLVPNGPSFYLPFESPGGGEQSFIALAILLKMLRADPRNPPWLVALDTGFFGRFDTENKQRVFDTLKSKSNLPLQTVVCVTFEKDAEALKVAENDTWIGATSAEKLTLHVFM